MLCEKFARRTVEQLNAHTVHLETELFQLNCYFSLDDLDNLEEPRIGSFDHPSVVQSSHFTWLSSRLRIWLRV